MKIDTTNRRVLVISDIHQEYKKARKIIDAEAPDAIVCLGDLFDSHVYDDLADVAGTVALYREIVNNPNNIMLLSNHDFAYHYIYNRTKLCSGYTAFKNQFINSIITPDEWNKVRWYCVIDDYLCTHAGVGAPLIPEGYRVNLESVTEYLDKESILANRALVNGKKHWFWQAGYSRCGEVPYGGILWNDFEDEYIPITTIKTLSGHTPADKIRYYNAVHQNHICIDCNLNEYLIIHNQKLEIKKYIDL